MILQEVMETTETTAEDLGLPSTSGVSFLSEPEETMSSQSSQSMPEEEVSIWVDEIELQQEKRRALNKALDTLGGGRISPILSTLNTTWEDISTTQQKYYSRKAKEALGAVLTIISPGQEEELWDDIKQTPFLSMETSGSTRPKRFDGTQGLVDVLVKAYNEAESWQTKRQILSLFANDFSRLELQELIPGLSKWRIDQARQHAIKTGKGQPVPSQPIFRQKIEQSKIDHFIDFISRPEFIQDVAFGTKTLKLDSGEKIIIPAVIRTRIPSRIIDQYKNYCKQEEVQPASDRSLYRMLEVCSASMQKSLQGLDSLTAEGAEAFDSMMAVIDSLVEKGADDQWGKNAKKELRDAKRYLKADFKAHVGRNEHCKDHCIVYALSDPNNSSFKGKCSHAHDILCERCESLRRVLQDVTEKLEEIDITEEQRQRKKFEVQEYVRCINAWKSHLLRLLNQDEAKQKALRGLTDDTCLIIMDWAMKYLPQRYRERMSDFFGKKGRNWHVSAVITKSSEGFQVECYVHLFDSCVQGAFAVTSIVESLLHAVRNDYQSIKKAYLRSDNAACYHNGPLLLSLPYISERTGITILRYDFSDPQAGKDICDRKIAPMKSHMRRWLNEKHDITTAEEMKLALESHGGIKGSRAAVVKLNPTKDNASDNKIPGISLLNNFAFEKNGIRVWRSFDIGSGRLIKFNELQIVPQVETDLQVIRSFGPRVRELGFIATRQETTVNEKNEIYSCNESECILTFKTQSEAEAHMDTGEHVRITDKESLYDSIRRAWADKVSGVKHASQPASSETTREASLEEIQQDTSTSNDPATGWALKKSRTWTKMSDKVKSFLVTHFDTGAVTGQKADPAQVSREMKQAKDENGQTLFQPEEWKTADQIKGFFSRLSAKRKLQANLDETAEEEEEEDFSEEDIEALEEQESFAALRKLIVDDMNVPNHPVLVENRNICEMTTSGKLKALKLAELKEICKTLNLEANGTVTRKKSFIEPLEQYIFTCSCHHS